MCHPKLHNNISKSVTKLSEDGQKKIKLISKKPMEGIIDISFLPMKKQISSIVESPVLNKNLISKDKLNICKKNSQDMKSSKTLEAESISNEKDFSPFYNEFSSEMFQKLWLPQMIDYPDLILNSLNGFSNTSDVNSFVLTNPLINQQNKNYRKILYQSLQSLQPNTMERESIIATRKIRFFPTSDQRKFFSKCFGVTRFIYNKTLDAIKQLYAKNKKKIKKMAKKGCIYMVKNKQIKMKSGSKTVKNIKNQCCGKIKTKYFCNKHSNMKPKYNVPLNLQYWRNIIIKKNEELDDNELWLSEIPYDTRQLAIKNLLANYKSCISNLKNGNIKGFDIKYKSRKHKNQFFMIDHRALKNDRVLFKSIFNYPLKMRKGEIKWFNKYVKKYKTKKYNSKNEVKTNQRKDLIITREYPDILLPIFPTIPFGL